MKNHPTEQPQEHPSSKKEKPEIDQLEKDLQEERTLEGMRIVRTGRGQYVCHSQTHAESSITMKCGSSGQRGAAQ